MTRSSNRPTPVEACPELRVAASARSTELPDVAQVVAQLLRVYGVEGMSPDDSDGGTRAR